MAPNSSQRTSQGSAQKTALQNKFKKFCQELGRAKAKEGDINNIPSVNSIKEALRNCRTKGWIVDQSIIADILQRLENDGNDICSRIGPSIFCCVLETTLQASPSPKCQRIMHLLGASLHRDFNSTEDIVQGLPLRKIAIGKECLVILLEYYVAVTNSAALRRWVGILCIQLFLDCHKNHEKIELAGEDCRRGLGRLIIDDPDELLRLISGQLVRDLHEAGTPLADLFPVSYEEHMYEDFPASKPNKIAWFKGFQDYLDALSDKPGSQSSPKIPASAGTLYFSKFFTLKPGPKFGIANHNVFIFVDNSQNQISMMSTAKDKMFDQILDIPTESIQQMTITIETQSQESLAIVEIDLKSITETGILDGEAVQLDMVSMRLILSDAKIMKMELSELCPEMEIHDGTQLSEVKSSDELSASQVIHTSTVEIMVHTEPKTTQIAAKNKQAQQSVESPEKNASKFRVNEPPTDLEVVAKFKDTKKQEMDLEEEAFAPNDGKSSPLRSSPIPPISRPPPHQGVKPKAKKPLIDIRRSLDSQTALNFSVGGPSQIAPETNKSVISPKNLHAPIIHGGKVLSKSKQPAQLLQSVDNHIYDFPTDGDGETSKDASTNKRRLATSKSKSTAKTNSTKRKTDKRKSAPAVLGSQDNSRTRKSQRAAPSKANDKLLDLDDSEDKEIIPAESVTGKLSKAKIQKSNAKTNDNSMGPPERPRLRNITADKLKDKSPAPVANENFQTHSSPQTDTRDDLVVEDDLYSASPPPKMPLQNQPQDNIQASVTKKQVVQVQKGTKVATLIVEKTGSVVIEESASSLNQVSMAKSKTIKSIKRFAKGMNTFLDDLGLGADDEMSQMPRLGITMTEEPLRKVTPPLNHRIPKDKTATVDFQTHFRAPNNAENDHIVSDLVQGFELVEYEPRRDAEPQIEEVSQPDPVQSNAEPQLKAVSPLEEQLETEPSHNPETNFNVESFPETESHLDAQLHPEAEPHVKLKSQLEENSYVDVEFQVEERIKHDAEPQLDTELRLEKEPQFDAVNLPQRILTIERHVGVPEIMSNIITLPIDMGSKRKAEQVKELPVKKRRSDAQTQTSDHSDQTSRKDLKVVNLTTPVGNAKREKSTPITRRSPRLVSRQTKGKEPSINLEKKNKANMPPPRSPRLAQKADRSLEKDMSPDALVDEKLTRKPQVISFGLNGARNQGPSTITRNSEKRNRKGKEKEDRVFTELAEKKRKREVTLVHEESPAKKRQHSSPTVQNHEDDGDDFGIHDTLSICSSPPAPLNIRRSPRRKLFSRPSSQGSKVDKNGSPIAPANRRRDHIGRLKASLVNETELAGGTVDAGFDKSSTHSSDVFGPRIALAGSIPKAGPSSPDAVITRYVAHERTANGLYKEISTTEVIAPEEVLPDPFIGQERRSSNFTESLQKDTGTREFVTKKKVARIVSPLQLKGDRKLLIADEVSRSEDSSGSSSRSNLSTVREPLKEKPNANDVWNLAIRPHYKNLHDVVHKIADELIIRLVNEEEKMDLIVDQYKQNGAKIVDSFTSERGMKRHDVLEKLDSKKSELVDAYNETKRFLDETTNDLKENSVSIFETEWSKHQQQIRKGIVEGRKVSE